MNEDWPDPPPELIRYDVTASARKRCHMFVFYIKLGDELMYDEYYCGVFLVLDRV